MCEYMCHIMKLLRPTGVNYLAGVNQEQHKSRLLPNTVRPVTESGGKSVLPVQDQRFDQS